MPNYSKIDNLSMFPISGDLNLKYGKMTSNFRVLSETNITNMWMSVIDRDAFVISCNEHKNGDTLNSICVEFFILGHYFRADLDVDFLSAFTSARKIYATILMGNAPIDPTESDRTPATHYNYMVVGVDSDDVDMVDYFTGVQFTTSTELCPDGTQNVGGRVIVPAGYFSEGEDPDTYVYYVSSHSLEILNYNTETKTWFTPESSRKKFEKESLNIDLSADIDGGEVE